MLDGNERDLGAEKIQHPVIHGLVEVCQCGARIEDDAAVEGVGGDGSGRPADRDSLDGDVVEGSGGLGVADEGRGLDGGSRARARARAGAGGEGGPCSQIQGAGAVVIN